MSRPRLKRRLEWHTVTNELVMTFAAKDCRRCEGVGAVDITNTATGEGKRAACPCVDAPFKAEYAGRLRRNKAGKLEFRELSSVAPDSAQAGAI